MNDQVHRDRLTEAKEKRRAYLRKKTNIYTTSVFAAVLGLGGGAMGMIVALLLLNGFLWPPCGPLHPSGGEPCPATAGLVIPRLVIASTPFVFSFSGVWLFRSSLRKAKSLPYVPSVREHIDDLPVEEVLLRASDQPAATPEELLRAAQAGNEAEAQELLRAVSRESDEQDTQTPG